MGIDVTRVQPESRVSFITRDATTDAVLCASRETAIAPISTAATPVALRPSPFAIRLLPDPQQAPHDHQLANVVRGVVRDQEQFTQVGLTAAVRDPRGQLDVGI